MKKFLYGTTALVAAGMISSAATAQTGDPIELSVGGKFEGFVGFASSEDYGQNGANGAANVDYSSVAIDEDSELYFDGETTLDNGLTVGVAIQMDVSDANNPPNVGNQMNNQDEAYAYVSGGFGEIQAGTKDQVTNQMAVYPYSQTGADGEGHDTMFVKSPNRIASGSLTAAPGTTAGAAGPGTGAEAGFDATSNFVSNESDDATVSYISPSLAGFQLGVSYTPQPGGGRGLAMNTQGNNYDRFDIAGSYNASMQGVDIAASLGYTSTSRSDGASTTSFTDAAGNSVTGYDTSDDPTTWNAGLSVGYANFELAGYYMARDYENTGQWMTDGNTWTLGASYGVGPYEMGLNYISSTAMGGDAAGDSTEDELEEWELRGAYTLGPGVTMQASAFTVDYENESTASNATVQGVDADGDGTGVVGGLVLGF